MRIAAFATAVSIALLGTIASPRMSRTDFDTG